MGRSVLANFRFSLPVLSRDFAFVLGPGLEGIWKDVLEEPLFEYFSNSRCSSLQRPVGWCECDCGIIAGGNPQSAVILLSVFIIDSCTNKL